MSKISLSVIAVLLLVLGGCNGNGDKQGDSSEQAVIELPPGDLRVGDRWTVSGETSSTQPVFGETDIVTIMTYEIVGIEEGFVTYEQRTTVKNMEGEVVRTEGPYTFGPWGTHITGTGIGPIVNTDWETNEHDWVEIWGQGETVVDIDVFRETKKLAGYRMEVVYFYCKQHIVDEAQGSDFIMEMTYGYSEEYGVIVEVAEDMEGRKAGEEVDSETFASLTELTLARR